MKKENDVETEAAPGKGAAERQNVFKVGGEGKHGHVKVCIHIRTQHELPHEKRFALGQTPSLAFPFLGIADKNKDDVRCLGGPRARTYFMDFLA